MAILERWESLEIVDNEGQTALHLAVKEQGNEDVVEFLAESGASVKKLDSSQAEAESEWAMYKAGSQENDATPVDPRCGRQDILSECARPWRSNLNTS